jgi:hypothetical protein
MKTSKAAAQDILEMEGYEGRFIELVGYTVGLRDLHGDADLAELFKGCPKIMSVPTLGCRAQGQADVRYVDGTEEMITEGEAYYARSGHLPSSTQEQRLWNSAPPMSCSRRWTSSTGFGSAG